MAHLNFFYHNNELCLKMNETFAKYVDTLSNIIKTINSKLEHTKIYVTDYDTLQQINSKWIQSKYKVDSDFISWWNFCIENKYTDYLKDIGKVGDLLCLKNLTLDTNFNIKIQDKHKLSEFYSTFLKFDVCSECYFGLKTYNYYSCWNYNSYQGSTQCSKMYKKMYFNNLINAHEEIDNRVTESYREVTQEFFDDINRLQKKFDYFDNNHKQDVSHLRTDVESCTFMIDNERKAAKTHREEVDMQINDLNHRMCKMEFLLSGRDNYEANDKAMSIPKQPLVIEDVVVDQAQMIKELRKELKKQRDDFEAYKRQKQRQLAALM